MNNGLEKGLEKLAQGEKELLSQNIVIYNLNKEHNMYIYFFLVEIHTARPILVKFHIGIYFDCGKDLSMVLTLYPDTLGQGALNKFWGASTASIVQLWKCFKTKFVG